MAKSYYVQLGYDYYSYPSGSVWSTPNSNDNRWLQYCMTQSHSVNSSAVNFQFSTGDQLYFVIWDLSVYPPGTQVSQIALDLDNCGIGVNMCDGTLYTSANAPVSVAQSNGTLAWGTHSGKSAIGFTAITMAKAPSNSPWGPCWFASSNTLGPLTISGSGSMTFKMNFKISASYNGDGKTHIADPAPIIDGGTPLPVT